MISGMAAGTPLDTQLLLTWDLDHADKVLNGPIGEERTADRKVRIEPPDGSSGGFATAPSARSRSVPPA